MENRRLTSHPVLEATSNDEMVDFTFNQIPLKARKGEMIASALFAAGFTVFGHHHRDRGPLGIFCANGQCSQCTVIANGAALKSCMTAVTPNMIVQSPKGNPPLSEGTAQNHLESKSLNARPQEVSTEVLIIGGGPAGLSAAAELGRAGINVLLIDDKPDLGGKLTLQTHGFFGSVKDCYAGTRGIDIGTILEQKVTQYPNVTVWLNATAIGVFFDGKVGVTTPDGYKLISSEQLLIAMGAREKALAFPGSDLPGVYGAGAFQTLVNRDLVKASKKLFILGGGNVGLIGAYHALQAGIDVVGLVEALPACGGYKVHADKIKRLGVPIWTSHTVVRAEGEDTLKSVTIAQIDNAFKPIPGTEQTFEADTLLIAVGLSPVDEILRKTREYGLNVCAAGDTDEVAEASAAIFSGRIMGRKLAQKFGVPMSIPDSWEKLAAILRSRPGATKPWTPPSKSEAVYPVIRCVQEIPCNPCTEACPKGLISMETIMDTPGYHAGCIGCANCVTKCPGLAINLVCEDYDPEGKYAALVIPFEFGNNMISFEQAVHTVDFDGNPVGEGKVVAFRERADQDRRRLVILEVPFEQRLQVAGFTIRGPSIPLSSSQVKTEDEDPIICRCERVKKSEIVYAINQGVRDINKLKALTRATMGGCGGKTCTELILRVYREQGVKMEDITLGVPRPLTAEVPLGLFVKESKADE